MKMHRDQICHASISFPMLDTARPLDSLGWKVWRGKGSWAKDVTPRNHTPTQAVSEEKTHSVPWVVTRPTMAIGMVGW